VEENSDEEQEVVEKFAVEKTFNPTIQYFNQVVTHKAVNPEQAGVLPKMNEAIDEYLNQDQEVKEAALPEVEEFEAAFDLVHNVPEEGLEANRRQRVTWRDIIEQEEEKIKQRAGDVEQQVPQTEEEAMRMKGDGKGDINGDDDDATK